MQDTKKSLKYIFVSGGVLSGVGKGITTASIALLLKSRGFKVTAVKCDMYLNIDAGTMNPVEHGEVFVTDDKAETDQDLGHYERFLNESLPGRNYITAGQVYWEVLNRERRLEYNGQTVDTYSEIPEEIIRRINIAAKNQEIVIVELGGTVGEYQNIMFFEAIRRLKIKHTSSVLLLHVGYLPLPKNLGELKSKPLQQSIHELNSLGLRPDFVIARAEKYVDNKRREKIAFSASLDLEDVISNPDVETIYEVPLVLEKQNLTNKILEKLKIKSRKKDLVEWEKMVANSKISDKEINIGIVGKYISSDEYSLEDAYVCVNEALKHACFKQGAKLNIKWVDAEKLEQVSNEEELLQGLDGILVPQGWGSRGTEGKIRAVKYARENKIPFLGLCFGMQMAAVEFARNVLGYKKANSEEIDQTAPERIIHIMPGQKAYLAKKQFGGTIRLGTWDCRVKKGSLLREIYKKREISERHRHRYEFNNAYRKAFEINGVLFSGLSPDEKLVEALELNKNLHPFFVGVQFHPELKSRPLSPHPIFLAFIKAASKNKVV
ncbi:MAG: CTP synthase [Candidatus Blackburnbacteria bacterium RIFCSPLOWO2_01_FULL_41_27]|uniref:CTP synthase n=1 Tax=Candidatus Blackburnbacteria bacterium RIFCSPLOWO2_01_FULL_41_27 TaxID=1797520 RepID=A0A1G1VDN9_9BACT|nr:MAG: CTP synthase [Candidatus Blackburnbacteria bacterium RIFCSPLOWO2_01_FULL_41_27]